MLVFLCYEPPEDDKSKHMLMSLIYFIHVLYMVHVLVGITLMTMYGIYNI
jgi:hypothetical protein